MVGNFSPPCRRRWSDADEKRMLCSLHCNAQDTLTASEFAQPAGQSAFGRGDQLTGTQPKHGSADT